MKQIQILRFWLPLLASWMLMTGEAPMVSAAVNRLPNEVVMLAALGVTYGLAVLIESPIINLLATATALVQDRASYRQVRRFTVHWMILLTAASWAIVFTPLFDWMVLRAMAIPAPVAEQVKIGLAIMIPWSAAIAWRRFLQGVLIHFNRTRFIAWGTLVRVVAVAIAVGVGLAAGVRSGIQLATTALICGVVVEALFATWAARPLHEGPLAEDSKDSKPLSYGALLEFHMPLAGTAVLTLLIQPAIAFALARLAEPTLSLAAWPIVFQLTLFMRATALSLPEVIIALDDGGPTRQALRRFSVMLTGATFVAMFAVAATPLADFYLFAVQGTTAEIGEMARYGFWLFLPMPAMVVVVSWYRGLLMKARKTGTVNWGVAVRLAVLLPVLGLGLLWQTSGMAVAAWSVNFSVAAELIFLAWASRSLDTEPGSGNMTS